MKEAKDMTGARNVQTVTHADTCRYISSYAYSYILDTYRCMA